MRLTEKLASISPDQAMRELDSMLNKARVGISWWGQRVVSINGYEGSLPIDEIAYKYLKTS